MLSHMRLSLIELAKPSKVAVSCLAAFTVARLIACRLASLSWEDSVDMVAKETDGVEGGDARLVAGGEGVSVPAATFASGTLSLSHRLVVGF